MKTTVFDVAKYIIQRTGPISAMKLQKLIYYAQAWSLVWDDAPLFDNEIEAWANGPVCRDLYDKHRGIYQVCLEQVSPFSGQLLSAVQAETVDEVLRAYAEKSAQWLSDQTHIEDPWIHARAGLGDGERGSQVISHNSMADYYLKLQP
jgi:uncharacterized phage-associated protein